MADDTFNAPVTNPPSVTSLVDLMGGRKNAPPKIHHIPEQASQRIPEPPLSNQETLSNALREGDLTKEDIVYLNLLTESRDLVKQKMSEDRTYGALMVNRLGKLSPEKKAELMINEADKLKIEFLKATDPDFTAQNAALVAAGEGITFGNLDRFVGGVDSIVDGRPAYELISERAEFYRLLGKEFKKADMAGSIGSFFVPASPARGLVNASLKVTDKVLDTAKILQKASKSQKFMRIALGQGSAGLGLELARRATEGATNIAGELVNVDLDRVPADESAIDVTADLLQAFGYSAVLGSALGVGGEKALKAGVNVGGKVLRPVGKFAQKAAEEFDRFGKFALSTTTGIRKAEALAQAVYERAIKKAGVAFKKTKSKSAGGDVELTMKGQAGQEFNIGDDLVDFLTSKKSKLPEVRAAHKLLDDHAEKIPDIDLRVVFDYLDKVSKIVRPDQSGQAKALEGWKKWMLRKARVPVAAKPKASGLVDPKGKKITPALPVQKTTIKAKDAIDVIEDIQDMVRSKYGKEDNPFLAKHLIRAGRILRLQVRGATDRVKELNVNGKNQYKLLMDEAADRRRVLSFLEKQLGRDVATREKRAESFVANIFGKRKTLVQARLKKLDQKYGTNFSERARLADLAKQFGEQFEQTGRIPLLPQFGTGANLTALGLLGSAGVGGAVAGAASFIPGLGPLVSGATGLGAAMVTSPRFAVRLLGTSGKIKDFVQVMTGNMDIVNNISKNPAVHETVRGLAKQIIDVNKRSGPIAASGVLRLAADTPYFVGLVNAFDLSAQQREKRAGSRVVNRLINESNEQRRQ